MAPRPRRSTATTTSYAHLLTPLALSSDSSSSEDPNATQAQKDERQRNKRIKKRRATYIPDDSSGSEFEAAPPGEGGAEEEEEEDDDDLDADGVSDDDGPGGGDSDVSGSIVSGDDGEHRKPGLYGSRAGGYARRGRGRGGARGTGRAVHVAYAPAGRSDGKAFPSTSSGRVVPPRAVPPPNLPESGWDAQYPGSGPIATVGVPTLTLEGKKGERIAEAEVVLSGAGAGAGDKKGKGKQQAGGGGMVGMTDAEVGEMMETATANPFLGPSRKGARDMGWSPRRWEREEGHEGDEGERWREKEKWGAASYDEPGECEEKRWETVAGSDLLHFLPRPLPSLNTPIEPYTVSVPLPSSSSAALPGAGEEMPAPDDGATPGPSGVGEASTSASAAGGAAAKGKKDGAVRLLLGGVPQPRGRKDAKGKGKGKVAEGDGDEEMGEPDGEDEPELGERRVDLGLFESTRLDSYIPSKPGHLFNAGGPINALAWAPRPRRTGGVKKEYLALSTLSSLDTPLKHQPLTPSSANLDFYTSSPAFAGHVPSPSSSSSTSPSSSSHPKWPGAMIQIWSLSLPSSAAADLAPTSAAAAEGKAEAKGTMKLELGLCLAAEGDVWELAWAPSGGSGAGASPGDEDDAMQVDGAPDGEKGRLGILATAQRDGSVCLWDVPRPEEVRRRDGIEGDGAVFIKPTPLLRLRLPNASLFSLSWGSERTIAGGASNGWIAVWDVGAVLENGGAKEGDPPLRPTQYFPAHSSLIRSLSFILSPPPSLSSADAAARPNPDGEPTGIVSVAFDGSAVLSDLRASGGAEAGVILNHERTPLYTISYGPHTGCAYVGDQDDRIRALYLRPSEVGSNKRIAVHRGTVTSIATSAHHPFLLSTSVDGSATLTTSTRALRKRRVKGHFSQKLFRLDVSRKTGEVRVWDNLDVEFRQALDPLNASVNTSKKGGKKLVSLDDIAEEDLHTAAWPLEQGVLTAGWHPAIERAGMVATGWACGVGRVDWCEDEEE
ncbi:hypothetical protein JCM8097_003186 [Rhodosporidiobolus ruineniae]